MSQDPMNPIDTISTFSKPKLSKSNTNLQKLKIK